jgi:arylsulfatase A-like enzyme
MYDQLRFDYLSCYGHQTLHTPNFDRVAALGVKFDQAFVQSTICGSSRMCTYTGRYVSSHGSSWNNFPLKVGETTLGDHLRNAGMDACLVGKTHMTPDMAGMERLGIQTDSVIGARLEECGFDVFIRDDGIWGEGPEGCYDERRSPYNEYLKAKGYKSDNPWAENANAGITEDDNIATGWLMQNTRLPANIKEEDSETPWLTSRAIDFIETREGDQPWLMHLSYIKPHWPYVVPAPYNDMFDAADVQPAKRSSDELNNPHPIFSEFQNNLAAQAFAREEVRELVIPAYMGLVKQCDDQLGRLLDFLEATGRLDDTMIVLTSDHGDYLGDHWLGEKELFHNQSVKVPLIIYDPSSYADNSRGSVCSELVESIDLVPTFIEIAGGKVPDNIVEGKSLLPLLRGESPTEWREFLVSEYDYSPTEVAGRLDIQPKDARLFMIADKNWKFIHCEGGFRPMLFDLMNDPDELNDLGDSPDHKKIVQKMYGHLSKWARRSSQRTTIADDEIKEMRLHHNDEGLLIGVFDGTEVDRMLWAQYEGKAMQRFVSKHEGPH